MSNWHTEDVYNIAHEGAHPRDDDDFDDTDNGVRR
jgi:hypothetical protein